MTQRVPQQKMYYGFSLDEKVPKDHLLRKINEVVDFSFIYPIVKDCYSHTGAPSVDPVVVFKLSLIGYLYNVVSERRLLEEASLNLAYLWFLGYEIDEPLPDHSIMTKARIRFGVDIYREFFHRIVQACAEAGLVDGDTVFIDSTLIDSAASYKGGSAVRSRCLVEELNNAADEFVEQVFEQNTQLPSEEKDSDDLGTNLKTNEMLTSPMDPDSNTQAKEVADDEFSRCKVKLSLADSTKGVNEGQNKDKKGADKTKTDKKTNEMLASPTDPEANIVRRGSLNPRLCYKGHFLVDGGNPRIITAVGLSPGMEHDAHLLLPLLAEHSSLAGDPNMLSADMGYSTANAYYLLKVKDVVPAIPKKPTSKSKRDVPKSAFSYDKASDCYICPEGKILARSYAKGKNISYRSKKKDCKECPLKEKCLTGKAKTRSVLRSKDEDVFEWAAEHLQTQRAKAALKRRKIWPETAFADAKDNHGMSRAKHRGKWKVEIQVLLTAAVINIKKLVRYGGKHRQAGQAAGFCKVGLVPLFLALSVG